MTMTINKGLFVLLLVLVSVLGTSREHTLAACSLGTESPVSQSRKVCRSIAANAPQGFDVLQMGPGGDFAGATVIRVVMDETAGASEVWMNPGGDLADATIIYGDGGEPVAIEIVVMGPGGDFAGATVVRLTSRTLAE